MFSMGQEFSISVAWQFWLGGEAGRSVMRLHSRFQPRRQSSEDWMVTWGFHFQAIHVGSQLALSVGGGFNSSYVDLFSGCLNVLTIWQLASPRASSPRKRARQTLSFLLPSLGSHTASLLPHFMC